jgi:hypothetical protein
LGAVSEPLTASAEIRTGEAFPVLPIAQSRMVGRTAFLHGYPFVGLFAGMMMSSFVVMALPWLFSVVGIEASWDDDWLVSLSFVIQLIGTVMGYAMGWNAAMRRHAAKFLVGVKARGTPETIRFHYAIEADALAVSSDRISHRLAWHAIQEVMPAPDHWLLQVDTITIILPRRAFADEKAEGSFLRELLARISPEARGRSTEAAAFAG